MQVSLLLALLVSVTNACRREEELVSGSPLAEKVLCFLLDHFSYLQRTQGNQKKVKQQHYPYFATLTSSQASFRLDVFT